LEVYVGKNGDYATINEALQSVSYNEKAIIYIDEGIYEEKIFSEKRNITFIGAGPDKTIIRWSDYANKIHQDGKKFGTFRSYTAFFAGRCVTVKNLSIQNTSPHHKIAGQAIAAYVDSEIAHFTNVNLDSFQDTLFCAPLPQEERQKNGFFGPRYLNPRHPSFQFYHQCKIAGSIDFIFGSGDVLFHECEIISKGLSHDEVGYVAAPSGLKNGAGFVFTKCMFTNFDLIKNSVFIARPWREEGKVALLNCFLDDHINEAGFSPWNASDSLEQNSLSTFVEYESYGPGARAQEYRVAWSKTLDIRERFLLNEKIQQASSAWGINSQD